MQTAAQSVQVGARKGNKVTIAKWNHPNYKWRAEFIEAGRYKRKGFKTKSDAEDWAEDREKEALDHGTAATLTDTERSAVIESRADLEKAGLTLRDAICFAVQHRFAAEKSCTVAQLIDEAIASRERAGRSKRHVADLRSKLGRFKNAFGRRKVSTVTKTEVGDWLHGLKLKPKSYNSYRTALVTLFNEAKEGGFTNTNPAAATKTASVTESKYSALAVEDAANLLAKAGDAILPAIAIGLFTGLRSAEIERLDWSSVDLVGDEEMPHGFIWFEGEGAKGARHRIIPISENLRAWLLPLAREAGPVWPENGRKLHEAARLAAGFGSPSVVENARAEGKELRVWPNNAQRHSFASYHLAHHKNAGALSIYMGSSPRMIFNNYRKLVSAKDAATFWSVTPEEAENIITMKVS